MFIDHHTNDQGEPTATTLQMNRSKLKTSGISPTMILEESTE